MDGDVVKGNALDTASLGDTTPTGTDVGGSQPTRPGAADPKTPASAGAAKTDPAGFAELRPGDSAAWSFDEVDPWAWTSLDQAEDDQVDISGCRVTAVLVTLDAARWLPETLVGLAALRHRPTRLIAIDNNSSDSTLLLLERARDQGVIDAVYAASATTGFGVCLQSGLRQDQAVLQRTASNGRIPKKAAERDWIWLLHDDAVPAPDALERLLSHVTLDPSIDVTGPKLLLPKRRHSAQLISEIGVTISGTGRRELLVEPGEIDQGQRDEPRERLGVSTCGMLVRASVWEELLGLDDALPTFRDGVDFGWRAHLAGHRVMTCPRAEFTHRQVGRAGLRPRGAGGNRPGRVDRYLGMLVVAGHAKGIRLPFVWLRLVWSCLLRAVGYLFGKVPGRSLDEILALGSFLAHPGQIHSVRRRQRTLVRTPGAERVVRSLRPPWWSSLQVAAEAVSGGISNRYRSVAGELETASLDELTGDDFSAVTVERVRNPWLSPIVIAGAFAVVASVLAARGLFGFGSLVAPSLLPAQSNLTELWHSVWSPIVGAPSQSSPPWLALAALGSTLLAGRPEWFVTVLLCAVVPISLVTAYPVVRRVISGRRVRLWVAFTYALLPVLLGGTNQGRLSMSVFAIALPLLALAARALVLRRPRAPEAWRGGWGAGVVLVALVAFEPSMILFALVLGAVGAVALHRSPRKAGRIGIALAVPLVVLAPWWPSVISDWGRLFVGPDSALDGVPAAASTWRLLLGREVGAGLPPLWLGAIFFGVIWVVAFLGLARRPRSRAVLAGWISGLLSLTAAALLSRLVVSVPPVGSAVRPWTGAYLLVGFAALLLAGGVGVDGLRRDLRRRSFTWLQPIAVLAGLLVGLVTLLGAGWWIWAGAAGPIDRDQLTALPPYVLNALQSDERVRVLAVDLSGSKAQFAVIADDQIRLGDADRGYTFGGSVAAPAQAADLVVRLVAGTADSDIAPQLSELGIGLVWFTGASEEEKARIDNTPGLGAASGNARGTVWQLEPAVSRSSISAGRLTSALNVSPLGPPPWTLPPGDPGRQLNLGEAADPRWRATLAGGKLRPIPGGWQQRFELPTTGGTLVYSMPTFTHWFLFGQGVLLIVASVLAAPGIRRPDVRDPARSARRAATVGGMLR
jgi:hypothetical protein